MIYILVPTYDGLEDTINFLHSVKESVEGDYLVLLIDDHPDKITHTSLKDFDRVKVFTSNKEIWWVGCINFGIERLFNHYSINDNDIIIFANNDIQIDKKSFDILLNEIQREKLQIVHPRTFDKENREVSSGAKILSFFPYITRHPKNFSNPKERIDMGTARFLMMSGSVLNKVGYVNQDLIQYGGDNDFTLSAKRLHNINTYIHRDAMCNLNDAQTGIKNHNIQTVKELFKSFSSIKSPNNIRYRYRFFKKFFGYFFALVITMNMTINTFIKFLIKNLSR